MWNRRELLGAIGTGAAGFAFDRRSATTVRMPGDGQDDPHALHAGMLKECDEACGHCEVACNEAFHHCVVQAAAGKAEHGRMAQLVVDCAAFCTLSAAMIARHSPLMVESCRACGEACRICAEECGSPPRRDEVMKTCVAACKKCEASCRKMVEAMGGEHHRAGRS